MSTGTQVTIKGAGAFLTPVGEKRPRPFAHGATVTVADEVAEHLVADGVAVEGDTLPDPQPNAVGYADWSDEEIEQAKVADLLDWVGDDPARAERALEVEQAKGGDARKTLVEKLQSIVDEQ